MRSIWDFDHLDLADIHEIKQALKTLDDYGLGIDEDAERELNNRLEKLKEEAEEDV